MGRTGIPARPAKRHRARPTPIRTPTSSARAAVFALAALLWIDAWGALANQLAGHPSPYLALHAEDPVAWQEWAEPAVARARAEQKLLYLSIGYFSCHWCHVMQRESFRNRRIAALLNERFVPVKVDRELEPALDARMIEFAETTQGRAGWPMNVFLTPEGYPLYAVLYLPPEQFEVTLNRLSDLWQRDRENLVAIARREATAANGPGRPEIDADVADRYARDVVEVALRIGDHLHGGFGEQSKFPSVPQLVFLLDHLEWSGDPRVREFLLLTLDNMSANGLYDHIGGGFFRYATDPAWATPHFEKMLYDNALLAGLYGRAAGILGRNDYARVAHATLNFMIDAMTGDEGAMIASLSAVDDHGVEGGYYLWTDDQLRDALDATERRLARIAFRMTDAPSFDGGYLPMGGIDPAAVGRETGMPVEQVARMLPSIRNKLATARATRAVPVDGKQLAGWNGLALASLADAARTTGEPRFRMAAQRIRDFLVTRLWDGPDLRRAVHNGRPLGRVGLEDYAYVAAGLRAWARLTGEQADLRTAGDAVEQAWRRFYTPQGWRTTERTLIPAEGMRDVLADGPLPSPSAVVIRNSLALADEMGDADLRARALAALNSGHAQIESDPFWYATHVGAMLAATAREPRRAGATIKQ